MPEVEQETDDTIADPEFAGILKVIEEAETARANRIDDYGCLFFNLDTSYVVVHLTEALKPGDPRGDSPDFKHPKRVEIEGLKKRKTWRVVRKCDIPEIANVLGGRFTLAIKNFGTPKEIPKAKYIAQGHRDRTNLTWSMIRPLYERLLSESSCP